VRCADGAAGWADAAPYHRVILTVGAWDLAPAWVDQLARGGRLVLPLSLHRVQRSVAFERAGDHLASVSVRPCGFMTLRGSMAGPESIQSLGHSLFLELGGDSPIDPAAVQAALSRPGPELPLRMRVTGREVFDGLALWLALHEPDVGSLAALDSAPERDLVPPLCTLGGMTSTYVLVEGEALAALVRLGSDGSGAGEDDSFEPGVRGYGPGSEALASRLADSVQSWQRRGRPSTTGLRIRAYFAGTEAGTEAAAEAAAVIDKRYSRLVVDWPQDHSA
jgi:protein-L-isoaspartate(D-aspartate) O-methyltransferase